MPTFLYLEIVLKNKKKKSIKLLFILHLLMSIAKLVYRFGMHCFICICNSELSIYTNCKESFL